MTIDEAIQVQKWLGNNHFLFAKTFEDVKASTDMAIKSLEAWKKVKKEIDEATEMLPDGDFYIKNFDVKRIINKHYFSEVEE